LFVCLFFFVSVTEGVVQITDRHGEIVDEVPMTSRSPVLSMCWDKDGDYLAILQEGNGVVPLWSLNNRRVVPLDTNLKDPSFMAWSKTGPQLAVGTNKGNLLIYNKSKKQKIPIVGKHSKKVSCGDWTTSGNRLILGSDDRNITISNEVGDTLIQIETKWAPIEANFLPQNSYDRRANSRDVDNISCNLNGKALLLNTVSPNSNEDPIELTFGSGSGDNCKYGNIIKHHWLSSDLVLLGFSGGYLVVISTKEEEIGCEKQCARFHSAGMITFSYNEQLKRVATAGDDGVRIIDLADFKENKEEFTPTVDLESGRVNSLNWSPDGQILTISTVAGNVYNFLAKMSVLNCLHKASIAYSSSLREVSIVDTVKRTRPVEVMLKIEPTMIAIGGKHVAAAMNNRVYFHRISSDQQVSEQEYVGTVKEVQLNNHFAVVLTDNKATLHAIEAPPNGQAQQIRTFPSRDEGAFSKVTCVALTDEFLYYGTEAGTVEVFFLAEWTLLSGSELRLSNGIKKIVPNHNGTRVAVVDSVNQVMLYNPINAHSSSSQGIIRFDNSPTNIVSVIWDLSERNVVMLYDGKSVHTYVYMSVSMKGEYLTRLGPVDVSEDGEITLTPEKTELPPGNVPLISNAGVITCQVASTGAIATVMHAFFNDVNDDQSPHSAKNKNPSSSPDQRTGATRGLVNRFCQAIALMKLEVAWQTALDLDRRAYWLALSNRAMEMLNIDVALRVYRQLGDAGMVMALLQSQNVEDKFALAGNIALLFGDYARAQELYLASSRPICALDMRKDLLQWDQALKLAQTLAPAHIPDICVRYGQQLEFKDETEKALHMYEMCLNTTDNNGVNICPESLSTTAMAGVVRCNIRLGSVKQGIRLASELDDLQLYQECGDLLEAQKAFADAVSMFTKAAQWEKAAFVYTKYLIKQDKSRITEAVPILERVKNDQLNASFGKACAAAGKYTEAAAAYERANDMDKVIELRLRYLDQTQEAFDLVRQTGSAQAAQLVAEYCIEVNDHRGSIEFLLIANKSDEAFKIAQAQGHVETYTLFLGDHISSDDALKVAHFFEKNQDHGKAGKYYSMCGHFPRALKLFLQCGDREIDTAIEVVGKANNDTLTHQLIDFLVGERDGVPKDPNYIYRLYMALKKYDDAAKTALIIARQEQEMGNYNLARTVLYETIRQLEDCDVNVPLQMRNQFVALHSYECAKSLMKQKDHLGAARLFLRVAQNVSKFPLHTVGILTATVIECKRAKLNASCYEYAVMLMSQHRKKIQPDEVRKNIEGASMWCRVGFICLLSLCVTIVYMLVCILS